MVWKSSNWVEFWDNVNLSLLKRVQNAKRKKSSKL